MAPLRHVVSARCYDPAATWANSNRRRSLGCGSQTTISWPPGVEDAQGDHLRQLAAVLVLVVVPDRRGLWLVPRRRRPLLARLIGIVAPGGGSEGFPGGGGKDSFGVGEVCAQGVGLRCGGIPGGVDGGPNELLGGSEPERTAVLVRQRS